MTELKNSVPQIWIFESYKIEFNMLLRLEKNLVLFTAAHISHQSLYKYQHHPVYFVYI